MADYKQVKSGRLKLKGLNEPSKKKKQKKNKRKREDDTPTDTDTLRHGGWRKLENIFEVSGNIALQTYRGSYVEATDTGSFTVGDPRDDGINCPAPVEILTAVPLSNKIAIKSGYGRNK
ncbi:protein FRG1-like [Actinia tenebrosa]|uniref:Protein FRG1-like n=1 Tax=Actinia tenebrosa TaxID=6105 RepID=A0A6P8HDU4_ACTTE|nr:protein FRG1-like [Actinia tenebrosa]